MFYVDVLAPVAYLSSSQELVLGPPDEPTSVPKLPCPVARLTCASHCAKTQQCKTWLNCNDLAISHQFLQIHDGSSHHVKFIRSVARFLVSRSRGSHGPSCHTFRDQRRCRLTAQRVFARRHSAYCRWIRDASRWN